MHIIKALLKRLSSLKITVVCLVIYVILVGWGTLYQVEHGLYAAQHRFFYSWILLIGGWVPFPGGQLVSWIFGINLLSAACLMKFAFRLRKVGILGIHYGLMLLLLGAFITHLLGRESYLALYEGELSNVTHDYNQWELALWETGHESSKAHDGLHRRTVYAYDIGRHSLSNALKYPPWEVTVHVDAYHYHCVPHDMLPQASREHAFHRLPKPKEPSEALPGLELTLHMPETNIPLTLWGGHERAISLPLGDGNKFLNLRLRHRAYPMPMTLRLMDFKKQTYDGVDIAKSYESRVMVSDAGVERSMRIHMNHPFRSKDTTIYQASYRDATEDKPSQSIFAVVTNKGQWIPYIASLLITFGLLYHFGWMLVKRLVTPAPVKLMPQNKHVPPQKKKASP